MSTATQSSFQSDGEYGKPKHCANDECICKSLETYFWGPRGEILCKMHAKEAWRKYRLEVHGINPSAAKHASNPFIGQKRLSGVLVIYPGYQHLKDGVKSIWTPTKCYPYPNHRGRLGMKGSYPTDQCQIVSWGKHQPPQEATQ